MTPQLHPKGRCAVGVALLINDTPTEPILAASHALASLAETRMVAAAESRDLRSDWEPGVMIADADARGVELLAATAARHPRAVRLLLAESGGGDETDVDGVTVLPRGLDGATLRAICAVALRCANAERSATAHAARAIALPPEGATLEHLEREIFLKTLALTGGNQRRAANLLGLRESTFRFRLRKLAIPPRRERAAAASRLS
jgi:DNA-binding NtrC family response regulator